MTEFTHLPAAALPAPQREQILAAPGFGQHFTDHMASIDWNAECGWHNAQILPYGPLHFDPAASVFHYGQEIFEGLKAFLQPDNSVALFRPEFNARRMNASAARLALPSIGEQLFIEAIETLVDVDRAWVPGGDGQSLYLRPLMIANENFIGIRAARAVRLLVLASPAGNYFPQGIRPITLWLSEDFSRAATGGTGQAKCGGNYAAAMLAQQQATEHGCDQVLFTDPAIPDAIDEAASMNVFLATEDGTLITPRLNGNILDGITRRSIIELARARGLEVAERQVTVAEWRRGVASGMITEAFACGTAAAIVPIRALRGHDFEADFGTAAPGALALSLREELTAIQRGTQPDTHGWLHPVNRIGAGA